MFKDCSSLQSLNLSNFDTSQAEEISGIFTNCSSLAILDISNFNLENVYDDNLFSNLNNLKYINLLSFKGDLPNIDHTITYCADNSNNKDEIISNLSKTNSTNDSINQEEKSGQIIDNKNNQQNLYDFYGQLDKKKKKAI